jgi:prepilin-type processing-associated H-X9-DG protein
LPRISPLSRQVAQDGGRILQELHRHGGGNSAWFYDGHVDAPGANSIHNASLKVSIVLGCAVSPVERCGQLAGEGTDVHDPTSRFTQRRQESLGHRELPAEVDLELPARFL